MSYEFTFQVNAGREYVYSQKDALIMAVIRGLFNARIATEKRPEDFPDWDSFCTYLDSLPRPPAMRIQAWAEVAKPHGPMSVLWFRHDKPGEDEAAASSYSNAGLADLRIHIEALAADRSFVTVECLTDDMVPAMRELLREVARRYPEADSGIREWLSRPGPTSPDAAEPWDAIPPGRDREMVRLLHEGYTNPEIADELKRMGYAPVIAKTVANDLARLRKVYAPEVVPHRRTLSRKSG
jgi:hypothetical protein